MSRVVIALRELRYANLSFWRNPVAAFFGIGFPLLALVGFAGVFGHGTASWPGVGAVTRAQYYVVTMSVFGVVSVAFTNVAIGVSFARDKGTLRRLRASPAPTWAYVWGRVAHAVLVGVAVLGLDLAVGALWYGARVPLRRLPLLVAVVVVAATVLAVLGLAVTAVVPNADAAPAVVNAIVFPLLFVSAVFAPPPFAPAVLDRLARAFPPRSFVDALLHATYGKGGGVVVPLLLLAAWGAAGVVLAARCFRWESRR